MKHNYFIIFFFFLIFSVQAQQKTLLDKDGERIRGTAIAIGKNYENTSVAFSDNPANWQLIKNKNLNTVRICWVDPWFERRGFNHWGVNAPEVLAAYDKAVQNAVDNDMTIIINYHNVGEQVDLTERINNVSVQLPAEDLSRMKSFWEIMAPRYKDNPNVIYEITNEPLFNFSKYLETSFKTDFLEIYRQVRNDAPNREIIMFSFNGIHQDIENVINGYNDDFSEADWEKTSIGYHMYQGDFGDVPRKLSKNYRVICTEWDYDDLNIDYVFRVDGYEENSETLELYQHSWVDWSGWNDNSLNSIDNFLLPDAIAKGYKWWDNSPSSNNKITFRAKGTLGTEQVKVLVDEQEVETFSLSNQLANYTTTTPLTGGVKFEYFNDASTNMDVSIDYLAFGEVIKDSEDMIENTAVFQNGTCGGILSEDLNCNGFINYGPFDASTSTTDYTITVRARGSNADERVQLIVNGILLDEWTMTTTFQDYTATTNIDGTIQVKYVNDSGSSDAFVDYIKLGDITIQAEDMPTNTGTFQNGTCGGSFSELLACNGFIVFPSNSASQVLGLYDDLVLNSDIRAYPNPVTMSQKMTLGVDGIYNNVSMQVVNILGQTVYSNKFETGESIKQFSPRQMNISTNGVYFIKFTADSKVGVSKIIVN